VTVTGPHHLARRISARVCLSAAVVISTLGLVACGSSGSSTDATAGTGGGATTPAAVGAFPVTIPAKLGAVTIDKAPTRVVTLGPAETEAALALGVTPVGIPRSPFNADGLYPWLAGKVDPKKTTLLPQGADGTFNIEQVAALRPDVILANTDFTVDGAYARLSKIAPTVSYARGLLQDTWQDVTRTTGKALGTPTEADTLVTRTEGAITSAKTANPGVQGRTYAFALAGAGPSLAVSVNPNDFSTKLFNALGLKLAPTVAKLPTDPTSGSALLSLEKLDQLNDADLLLLSYLVPTAHDAVTKLGAYQALPAVKAGHAVTLPTATATALRTPGPLSIVWALDQLKPALAGFSR